MVWAFNSAFLFLSKDLSFNKTYYVVTSQIKILPFSWPVAKIELFTMENLMHVILYIIIVSKKTLTLDSANEIIVLCSPSPITHIVPSLDPEARS